LRNFRQFNILAHIALFVCNFDVSRPASTASESTGANLKCSKLEFNSKRGIKQENKSRAGRTNNTAEEHDRQKLLHEKEYATVRNGNEIHSQQTL